MVTFLADKALDGLEGLVAAELPWLNRMAIFDKLSKAEAKVQLFVNRHSGLWRLHCLAATYGQQPSSFQGLAEDG